MSIHGRIDRRSFLANVAAVSTFGSALCAQETKSAHRTENDDQPLELGTGPHLILDDKLFDQSTGVEFVTTMPERLPTPVLDSAQFGVTQPYLSVLQDRESKRFRMWYNRGPQIWHAESDDGIAWRDPQVAWELPRSYGCSLLDDGPRAADKSHQFKLANWQATRAKEDTPEDDAGMWIGFSPDGLHWSNGPHNPALKTWPEMVNQMTRHGVGDTVDVFYDTTRRRYGAAVKVHALESDGFAPGPKSGRAIRRMVGVTYSDDFVNWSKPERILVPDKQDEGLFEFYGMGGIHTRGRLLIGFARILRDDLPCDAGGPVDGIGYSVLVTSYDGVTWHRYRDPFLQRNLSPGSWDHAMSWLSAAVPVGEELYLYYGGYARGHKIAPESERQIGMAKIRRDRYAGLKAAATGRLRTRPIRLASDTLTLNCVVDDGELRVRVLDANGKAIPGYDEQECTPLTGDHLAAEVRWTQPLSRLNGSVVRFDIIVNRGTLYAFDQTSSS